MSASSAKRARIDKLCDGKSVHVPHILEFVSLYRTVTMELLLEKADCEDAAVMTEKRKSPETNMYGICIAIPELACNAITEITDSTRFIVLDGQKRIIAEKNDPTTSRLSAYPVQVFQRLDRSPLSSLDVAFLRVFLNFSSRSSSFNQVSKLASFLKDVIVTNNLCANELEFFRMNRHSVIEDWICSLFRPLLRDYVHQITTVTEGFLRWSEIRDIIFEFAQQESSNSFFPVISSDTVWQNSSLERTTFILRTALEFTTSPLQLSGVPYKGIFTTQCLHVVEEVWTKLEAWYRARKTTISFRTILREAEPG